MGRVCECVVRMGSCGPLIPPDQPGYFMNTHPRLRKRAPSGPSRSLTGLSGFCLPRQCHRIACGAKIHKALPGTGVLCLEHVFMIYPDQNCGQL